MLHDDHNLRVLDSLVYTPSDRTIITDLGLVDSHIDTSIRHSLLTSFILRHIKEVVLSVFEDRVVRLEAAEKELKGLRSTKDTIAAVEAAK